MPFKPGVSGNPAGRPKGSGQGAELMQLLREQIPYERLVGALDKLVEGGDPRTIQYCMDRHLGRPAQAIQISGDAERPLHGLIGVVGRELSTIEAPGVEVQPAEQMPAPVGVEGEWVVDGEEEPDDTGVP